MIPEAQEYYNIAAWQKNKVEYNRISKFNSNKRRQILHGQIWFCDMGYNIGTEKNKMRPVLVMSNNKINTSEKIVVVCITDAKGKVNSNNLPAQDSWFLLPNKKPKLTPRIKPTMPAANTIAPSPFFYHILPCIICRMQSQPVAKGKITAQRASFFAPERCKTLPHLLYF